MATRKPITLEQVEQVELRARMAAANAQIRGSRLVEKSYATSYSSTRRSRTRSTPRAMGGSADAHLDSISHDTMRRDCQHVLRNNSVARAVVLSMANLVVGRGPQVKPTGKDAKLNAKKAAIWAGYTQNRGTIVYDGNEIEVGRFDHRGLQPMPLALHSLVQELGSDGDQVWVKTNAGTVQMFAGEQLVNPQGPASLNHLDPQTGGYISGVKMGAGGAPTAFHIAPYSPQGMVLEYSKGTEIPAEYCMFPRWPLRTRNTQTRGEPGIQSTITRFEKLDKIDEAVQAAMYIAACTALVYTTPNPTQTAMGMPVPVPPHKDTARDGKKINEFAPGAVFNAPIGSEVKQVTPTHPNVNHSVYLLQQMSIVSADIGAPIVLALMDPNGANYGGLRAMIGIAAQGTLTWRGMLGPTCVSPVYRFCMARQIRLGNLEEHDDWDAHDVVWPPMPVLNPKEEVAAAAASHALGSSSLTEVTAELTGRDYEQVVKERAFEASLREQHGLPDPVVVGAPPPESDKDTPTAPNAPTPDNPNQ